MNHIVIIGFMGSGKTRVGKRLAKDLGLPFIDVDRLIVKKKSQQEQRKPVSSLPGSYVLFFLL